MIINGVSICYMLNVLCVVPSSQPNSRDMGGSVPHKKAIFVDHDLNAYHFGRCCHVTFVLCSLVQHILKYDNVMIV